MWRIKIHRYLWSTDTAKFSPMIVVSPAFKIEMSLYCLELLYRNNSRNISSIPRGTYIVKKRFSQKFKHHFHVTGVPYRTLILIHVGNIPANTEGCILVGLNIVLDDKKLPVSLLDSKKAMDKLNELLPNEFLLIIN